MTVVAARCEGCGGAVVMEAGRKAPCCLFCGSESMVEEPVPEEVERPGSYLPFAVDEDGARSAFRKFARSSIWYPGDLRHAKLALNRVLLPAWIWSGQVETHYAAIVRASTRSGKRPVTGSDQARLTGVLVPSSTTISRAELAAISPFDPGLARPFQSEDPEAPWEIGTLTRTAATAAARRALQEAHQAKIATEVSSIAIRTACLFGEMSGDPMLLPVFVGAYRRKDRLYRIVLNGQTAKLTGKAPISAWRVLFAIALVVGVIGAIAVCVSGGALVGFR